ncbi:LysR substrate-binding domain-containing protein [Breoghania sp.]|uniref:LysR substrate-binding domain-containing protein n=1 Tax=Breoghania sp. TaxID=2065378 RepID=UPI002AA6B9E7|nr:LysR substrate-binding domain-containing protein [Breoghania sp.]
MLPMLDLDQLRTFLAIAEAGSFTQAAGIVNKTQSAVSMQMRRLEERIGRPLFARDGRQSRLTEDGERLLQYARRMKKLNDETLSAFDETELAGHVRLGTPDDYADRFLPEIMARFARSNPRAEIEVTCAPTPLLVQDMKANRLDIAIISQLLAGGQHGEEVVRREPLLWVTSARHCVHEERPVPLALGRRTCDWRKSAIAGLEEEGRDYRVLYSSWSSVGVGAAVTAGLAVSVLPESALRPGMRVLSERDGFPALPLCEIALLRSWHKSSRLIDALAEHIASSLDNLSVPAAAE